MKSKIELVKINQFVASSSKGKFVLISPSLDDLINKAEKSWAESWSSPNSESSSSTITPSKFLGLTPEPSNYIPKLLKTMIFSKEKGKIQFIEETFNSKKRFGCTNGRKISRLSCRSFFYLW
jgi:hypothetical protein